MCFPVLLSTDMLVCLHQNDKCFSLIAWFFYCYFLALSRSLLALISTFNTAFRYHFKWSVKQSASLKSVTEGKEKQNNLCAETISSLWFASMDV